MRRARQHLGQFRCARFSTMEQPSSGSDDAPATTPVHSQLTSLSLLERVRAHDPEAWHRLVGLFRPLVLSWCALARISPTDAEDITQEVFAAAAAALNHFHRDQPGDTFRGWLRSI